MMLARGFASFVKRRLLCGDSRHRSSRRATAQPLRGLSLREISLRFALLLFSWQMLSAAAPGQETASQRTPVLVDTDVGTAIDDAFALGLIFGSYELDVQGVTTVGADTKQRAMMMCRFLTATGRRHTAVAAGANPQPERKITRQFFYYYHPDVLFDRTKKPEGQSAVEFLHARLRRRPAITLLALGPLTNIARLIEEHPDAKSLVKRVVLVESNLALDPAAAKTVLQSGLPLTVVSTQVAGGLKLSREDVRRVFAPGTALSRQVQTLYQMWDQAEPPLADVLAASLCFDNPFVTLEKRRLEMADGGARQVSGAPNVSLTTSLRGDAFRQWYVARMASLLPPEKNPSRLVDQGAMPHRVHVAEDFDTDIERRWWMSGKPATDDLPPGSRRAVRGVLTHDFDDLLMSSRRMYTAVIFNPVPGPPMGKRTRLSFRYWLRGTDAIRVQIYSLTNGYHRQLVIKNLPQGDWRQGAVDLTEARRPDGTGGPLGEGERIDDIQFYVDPDADLRIDDVVLYDAAPPEEKRPFPRRILFTGVFDTGKQGKEWPGTFEIVPEQGYFWRAARSVVDPKRGAPSIQLNLRGQRKLAKNIALSFRYQLTGADTLEVHLVNTQTGQRAAQNLPQLQTGAWRKPGSISITWPDRPTPTKSIFSCRPRRPCCSMMFCCLSQARRPTPNRDVHGRRGKQHC